MYVFTCAGVYVCMATLHAVEDHDLQSGVGSDIWVVSTVCVTVISYSCFREWYEGDWEFHNL